MFASNIRMLIVAVAGLLVLCGCPVPPETNQNGNSVDQAAAPSSVGGHATGGNPGRSEDELHGDDGSADDGPPAVPGERGQRGESNDPAVGENPRPADPEPVAASADAVRAVIAGPVDLVGYFSGLLPDAIDAVRQASILANGGTALVITGALRQLPGSWEYVEAPADRLRVELLNGRVYELFVERLEGDFSGNGASLLSGDHAVRMRIAREGELDLTLESVQSRPDSASLTRNRLNASRGRAWNGAAVYYVDLRSLGTSFFENSAVSGTELRDRFHLSGTVAGTGIMATIDEDWDYNLVQSEGVVVTSTVRRMNNAWEQSGTRFALRDAITRIAFRDGRPNELDTFWNATGELLRDDVPYGRLALLPESRIRIVAETPVGRIELQSWNR